MCEGAKESNDLGTEYILKSAPAPGKAPVVLEDSGSVSASFEGYEDNKSLF